MRLNFNEALTKIVLIFLLGIAIYTILGRIEMLSGSVWKDVLSGASSVLLAEVFFNFKRKGKTMNHNS